MSRETGQTFATSGRQTSTGPGLVNGPGLGWSIDLSHMATLIVIPLLLARPPSPRDTG